MASPLTWKIYQGKSYMAATRHIYHALIITNQLGHGSVIKYADRIVWREGKETCNRFSHETIDTIYQRINSFNQGDHK